MVAEANHAAPPLYTPWALQQGFIKAAS